MPIYRYKALNESGAKVTGSVEAHDEDDAFARLQSRRLSPFSITKRVERFQFIRSVRKLSQGLLVRYVRQLATLTSAGLTLLEAFDSLARSRVSSELSDRSRRLRRKLREGARLSEGLVEVFPELPDYVGRLAELGEATGQMARSLADAAERMEQEERMRSEIRSALTYPIFLLVVGGLIILLMFIFVVPRFAAMIDLESNDVPMISRSVIGFGVWFQSAWHFVALALASLMLGTIALLRRARFAAMVSAALERTPLIGRFMTNAHIAGWARTVGIALKNGAPMLDALALGERACRSQAMTAELQLVRKEVRAGRAIDEALSKSHYDFGEDTVDLIRTGRSSGTLAEMLMFISGLYEAEAMARSKRITSLIEPVTILIISGIVALIVISVVLAMTSIYEVGL